MASDTAKKVAGTYIPDEAPLLPSVLAWLTTECRAGALAAPVRVFCERQPEMLEQSLVLVEHITSDRIQCRIPCRCYDHESDGTFGSDVRFTVDPRTGACQRVESAG